jgi:hypothetical protein
VSKAKTSTTLILACRAAGLDEERDWATRLGMVWWRRFGARDRRCAWPVSFRITHPMRTQLFVSRAPS